MTICSFISGKQEDLKSPYVAPVLAEDLTNMPETLVLSAEFDPLRDEGEDYAKRLKEAGNKVTCYRIAGAFHGYFALEFQDFMWKRVLRILTIFTGGVTMQKKKRSQWRKLDNAAQAFPAATRKKDTGVFRLYFRELKEDVIEEVLQKSSGMYAGKVSAVLFGSQERAVLVLYGAAEFKTKSQGRRSPPCSGLYVPDREKLLFEGFLL